MATIPTGAEPAWGFQQPNGEPEAWHKTHWLYVMASGHDETPIKIGITNYVAGRVLQLESGNPYGIRVLHTEQVCRGLARQAERRLHQHFAKHSIGREWFALRAADVVPDVVRMAELANIAVHHLEWALDTREEAAEATKDRSGYLFLAALAAAREKPWRRKRPV